MRNPEIRNGRGRAVDRPVANGWHLLAGTDGMWRQHPRPVSRREAVRLLGILTAGLAWGCAPMHHLVNRHATMAARDDWLQEQVLRAFVATVIPGVDIASPDLVRVFYERDELYANLVRCRAVLVGDLCRRSERFFGTAAFQLLDASHRTQVVQTALQSDLVTRRLYCAAIWVSQLAVYASIFDDAGGCELIDFQVRYRPRPVTEITYPEPGRLLARAITSDGNYD